MLLEKLNQQAKKKKDEFLSNQIFDLQLSRSEGIKLFPYITIKKIKAKENFDIAREVDAIINHTESQKIANFISANKFLSCSDEEERQDFSQRSYSKSQKSTTNIFNTSKNKGIPDFVKYTVLDACNPSFSKRKVSKKINLESSSNKKSLRKPDNRLQPVIKKLPEFSRRNKKKIDYMNRGSPDIRKLMDDKKNKRGRKLLHEEQNFKGRKILIKDDFFLDENLTKNVQNFLKNEEIFPQTHAKQNTSQQNFEIEYLQEIQKIKERREAATREQENKLEVQINNYKNIDFPNLLISTNKLKSAITLKVMPYKIADLKQKCRDFYYIQEELQILYNNSYYSESINDLYENFEEQLLSKFVENTKHCCILFNIRADINEITLKLLEKNYINLFELNSDLIINDMVLFLIDTEDNTESIGLNIVLNLISISKEINKTFKRLNIASDDFKFLASNLKDQNNSRLSATIASFLCGKLLQISLNVKNSENKLQSSQKKAIILIHLIDFCNDNLFSCDSILKMISDRKDKFLSKTSEECIKEIRKYNVSVQFLSRKIYTHFQSLFNRENSMVDFTIKIIDFAYDCITKNSLKTQVRNIYNQKIGLFCSIYYLVNTMDSSKNMITKAENSKEMELLIALASNKTRLNTEIEITLMKCFPFNKLSIEQFFAFFSSWIQQKTMSKEELLKILREILKNIASPNNNFKQLSTMTKNNLIVGIFLQKILPVFDINNTTDTMINELDSKKKEIKRFFAKFKVMYTKMKNEKFQVEKDLITNFNIVCIILILYSIDKYFAIIIDIPIIDLLDEIMDNLFIEKTTKLEDFILLLIYQFNLNLYLGYCDLGVKLDKTLENKMEEEITENAKIQLKKKSLQEKISLYNFYMKNLTIELNKVNILISKIVENISNPTKDYKISYYSLKNHFDSSKYFEKSNNIALKKQGDQIFNCYNHFLNKKSTFKELYMIIKDDFIKNNLKQKLAKFKTFFPISIVNLFLPTLSELIDPKNKLNDITLCNEILMILSDFLYDNSNLILTANYDDNQIQENQIKNVEFLKQLNCFTRIQEFDELASSLNHRNFINFVMSKFAKNDCFLSVPTGNSNLQTETIKSLNLCKIIKLLGFFMQKDISTNQFQINWFTKSSGFFNRSYADKFFSPLEKLKIAYSFFIGFFTLSIGNQTITQSKLLEVKGNIDIVDYIEEFIYLINANQLASYSLELSEEKVIQNFAEYLTKNINQQRFKDVNRKEFIQSFCGAIRNTKENNTILDLNQFNASMTLFFNGENAPYMKQLKPFSTIIWDCFYRNKSKILPSTILSRLIELIEHLKTNYLEIIAHPYEDQILRKKNFQYKILTQLIYGIIDTQFLSISFSTYKITSSINGQIINEMIQISNVRLGRSFFKIYGEMLLNPEYNRNWISSVNCYWQILKNQHNYKISVIVKLCSVLQLDNIPECFNNQFENLFYNQLNVRQKMCLKYTLALLDYIGITSSNIGNDVPNFIKENVKKVIEISSEINLHIILEPFQNDPENKLANSINNFFGLIQSYGDFTKINDETQKFWRAIDYIIMTLEISGIQIRDDSTFKSVKLPNDIKDYMKDQLILAINTIKSKLAFDVNINQINSLFN